MMKSICITLPAKIEWQDYEKELAAVADGSQVMNFKVPFFPKEPVDKCYVAHRGEVIGWMKVVGMSEQPFECSTTGQQWTGKFIQRSGPFHYLSTPRPTIKPFRGWKYYD